MPGGPRVRSIGQIAPQAAAALGSFDLSATGEREVRGAAASMLTGVRSIGQIAPEPGLGREMFDRSNGPLPVHLRSEAAD